MYERIYSIGCFDYFHEGHKILLNKMKDQCKELIIGIHDDVSIEKLKNLKPSDHQNILKRMANVKQHADMVFIVPDCDPSFYLKCVLRENDNKENACYMRANDMPNFPGKQVVQDRISIEYLPYTDGISSTQIRKNIKERVISV